MVLLFFGGCVLMLPKTLFTLIPLGIVILNGLMIAAMYGKYWSGPAPFWILGGIDLIVGLGAGAMSLLLRGDRQLEPPG